MTEHTWPGDALKTLSDLITEAHTRIQQSHANINPVVGLRRGMRDIGIPADALTIDCLQSGKRIVLILHDNQSNTLITQHTLIDDEQDAPFGNHPFTDVTAELLYNWMREYFADE